MEIEVEAERPEDSRVYRASAKRSGEKSRKTKHRSSNHDGSAEGSRKHDSKPKIFRLLRSRGKLSDYKAKLTQFLSGIISRSVFCTFLTDNLTKSEIRQHNKFILAVLRNEKHSSKVEKKSPDEKRRSKHSSRRERSADSQAIAQGTGDVTKDRDGFAVPPPKREKHQSKRGDDRRHRDGDHEYGDRSAQGGTPPSPTMETHQSSNHTTLTGPESAELALPADLTKYLYGLNASALEHLLQETSMISQHLQATSSSSLPHGSFEQSQNQAPQTQAYENPWVPQTPTGIPNSAPLRNESFSTMSPCGTQDFDAPRITTFPGTPQFQSQYSYGGPDNSQYGRPGGVGQHYGQFAAHNSAPGFQLPTVPVQNGFGNFGQAEFQLGYQPTNVQQATEPHFGTNFPEPFVERFPNDFAEVVAPMQQPGTLPGVVADFQKAPDPPDPNSWWNSIVEPSVFQRGYPVLNGADAHGASYEGSAMWAQQFLQSNEHDNDYIYTSKA